MPPVAEINSLEELAAAIPSPGEAASLQVAEQRLTDKQRRTRIGWLVVLAAVYGISLAVPRASLPHVPLCWLNALTGLACPTCGLTRAFTEIGHGNFAAATQLNLLAIPVFLLGLGLAAALVHEVSTYRNWLCPWIGRHRVALLLLAASCVILRYVPMMLAA